MSACCNCNTGLSEQAAYCSNCGQSVMAINRPWYEVVKQMLGDLFDVDGRMLASLWLLLSRPGLLSKEYINGRRVAYTSPVRMYLVITLGFFFIMSQQPDGAVISANNETSLDAYSQAMFVLLPLFALLLKVFYRETYYLAHLVFAVYLFSAMFIVLAVMLPIETAADRYIAVAVVQGGLLVYMLVYCVVALQTTYADSWPRTILKSLGLLLLFLPMLGGAIVLVGIIGVKGFG